MALLFFDGFEANDSRLKWRCTGTHTIGSPGRFGAGSYLLTATSGTLIYDLASPANKVFVGAALGATVIDSSARVRLALYGDSQSVMHLYVSLNSNAIVLYRGDGTLIGSYSSTFLVTTLYYIELSATIADSGGTCEVRYNGQTVITYTGDTKNGGTNTTIDGVGIYPNGGLQIYVDDFYLCNDSGSAPHNNFLGDIRVQTIVPNAAGSSTQFTPSSGANYTTVDELPYSASDYVTSATSGNRDTYALGDIVATTTIYGVQNNVIAKKTDSSAVSLKPAFKSSSTVSYGTTKVLSANAESIRDLRIQDPNTSAAWTDSGVNALEAGFEVA